MVEGHAQAPSSDAVPPGPKIPWIRVAGEWKRYWGCYGFIDGVAFPSGIHFGPTPPPPPSAASAGVRAVSQSVTSATPATEKQTTITKAMVEDALAVVQIPAESAPVDAAAPEAAEEHQRSPSPTNATGEEYRRGVIPLGPQDDPKQQALHRAKKHQSAVATSATRGKRPPDGDVGFGAKFGRYPLRNRHGLSKYMDPPSAPNLSPTVLELRAQFSHLKANIPHEYEALINSLTLDVPSTSRGRPPSHPEDRGVVVFHHGDEEEEEEDHEDYDPGPGHSRG